MAKTAIRVFKEQRLPPTTFIPADVRSPGWKDEGWWGRRAVEQQAAARMWGAWCWFWGGPGPVLQAVWQQVAHVNGAACTAAITGLLDLLPLSQDIRVKDVPAMLRNQQLLPCASFSHCLFSPFPLQDIRVKGARNAVQPAASTPCNLLMQPFSTVCCRTSA